MIDLDKVGSVEWRCWSQMEHKPLPANLHAALDEMTYNHLSRDDLNRLALAIEERHLRDSSVMAWRGETGKEGFDLESHMAWSKAKRLRLFAFLERHSTAGDVR